MGFGGKDIGSLAVVEQDRLISEGYYDKEQHLAILDLAVDIYDGFHAIVYNVGYAIKDSVERLREKYNQ